MAKSTAGSRVYAPLFELARGGMGRVDLVVRREDRFERLFAMKRLRGELRDEEDARAMFLEEARLAGLLRHPNVVSVLDVGSDDDGPFLVMEYIESISVATLIEKSNGALLPVPLCIRIILDVAHGLHAAHVLQGPGGESLALVHRDVSPPNILVGFDGVTRITDFGIARAQDRSHKTATGWLKGKIRYMAPEQLRFEEIDHRTDLFALGIVLFELLSGQKLYDSNDVGDAARRILSDPPPDIADFRTDVDPEIVELLFELLAKNKEARPSAAREVAHRLEHVLAGYSADENVVRVDEYLGSSFAHARTEMQEKILRRREALALEERSKKRRPLVALCAALALLGLGATFTFARPAPSSSNVSRESVATADPSAAPSSAPTSTGDEAKPLASGVAEIAPSLPPPMTSTAHTSKRLSRTPPKGGRHSPPVSPAGSTKSGTVPIWERYE